MSKFIVLDDVFPVDIVQQFAEFDYGPAYPQRWVEPGELPLHEQLLAIASEAFDLSRSIGYELWCNKTAVGWHYDHDEPNTRRSNQLICPPCSIVYYAKVEGLTGGDFETETMRITPVTNRLVVFAPGVYHRVNEYTGTRIAVSINPWNHRVGEPV